MSLLYDRISGSAKDIRPFALQTLELDALQSFCSFSLFSETYRKSFLFYVFAPCLLGVLCEFLTISRAIVALVLNHIVSYPTHAQYTQPGCLLQDKTTFTLL